METRANPNSRLFLPDEGEKELVAVPRMKTRGMGQTQPNTQHTEEDTAPEEEEKELLFRLLDKGKKFADEQEKNLGHFYNYQVFHPRFLQILVVILGIGIMAACLVLTIRYFNNSKTIEPIYTKIEGIKRLGEMHLVKQQYESVIPITKQKEDKSGDLKKETLEFLLIAPIEVTGYIDFSKIKLEVLEDSLLRIALPEAKVSRAYLDFSRTEEFVAEGKMRIFGQRIERINHKEAYFDIARGINGAKTKVEKSAEEKHFIKDETMKKAEMFLRNFVSTLGYRVEFNYILPEESAPTASDSTSNSTPNS